MVSSFKMGANYFKLKTLWVLFPRQKRNTTVNSQSSVGGSSYLRLIRSHIGPTAKLKHASVFMFSRHQKISIQGSLRNISQMKVKCGINDRNVHDKKGVGGSTVGRLFRRRPLWGWPRFEEQTSVMADNRMSTATPQQLNYLVISGFDTYSTTLLQRSPVASNLSRQFALLCLTLTVYKCLFINHYDIQHDWKTEENGFVH